jgi:lipoprotein-anchoring transpeptidase ErfK/SrfK
MTRKTSLMSTFVLAAFIPCVALSGQASKPSSPAQPKGVAAVDATPSPDAKLLAPLDPIARETLARQVALDRAGFSPGAIDASRGKNTDRALAAYQAAKGSAPDANDANAVTTYSISAEDAAGPFVEAIPTDMVDKSKLAALAYTSIQELLAERFHSSTKLLQRLNPTAKFAQGEAIVVPNVEPFSAPGLKSAPQQASTTSPKRPSEAAPAAGVPPKTGDVARAGATDAARAQAQKAAASAAAGLTVIVTDATKTLEVQDAAGATIFHAPVTVGSEHDPLPVGQWKVTGVSRNPSFNYNPDLFWDADAAHAKAKIPPGPNNPVGVVWIDLSKEHYGIHGTPEPSRIGYTESHGCIRLTNWDAMRLAALVAPGTKVILQ